MDISEKGLLRFYKQVSSLMDNRIYHRRNMFCLMNPTLVMTQPMSDFEL